MELASTHSTLSLNSDLNRNIFGKYLMSVFPPFGSDLSVMAAGARALASLALNGMGAMTTSFVSRYINVAIEWLEHSTFMGLLEAGRPGVTGEVLT